MAMSPNEIPGSDFPRKIRTGFSMQPSAIESLHRACMVMIRARFAQNTDSVTSEGATRISQALEETVPGLIPSTGLTQADQVSIESIYTRLEQACIPVIRPKLSPALRYSVPEELILLSGFTPGDQSRLEMAGCYIRLGNNLRGPDFALNNLAATSFIDSGILYSMDAHLLFLMDADDSEQDTDLLEYRVDLLVSAAQSYYWAYYNAGSFMQKDNIKNIAIKYFGWASEDAALLSTEKRTTWLNKIGNERTKLLDHAG